MNKEGAYVDIVGQYSSLHNKFNDSYSDDATQMGRRGALSIEVGKPIGKLGDWMMEPQAQLIYMHTKYNGFTDSVSHIDGYNVDALRGRLGMRFFNETTKEATKKEQYYGIVNVLHDFKDPKALHTNNTSITEKYAKTNLEVGLGMNYQIAKDTFIYTDARYQHSIDNSPKSQGVTLNLGVKVGF